MSRGSGAIRLQLQEVFDRGAPSALSEGQLLRRFAADRDEAAFSTLVARHGPMVLGVCRRVLRDEHEVEDAFQATFLVLARKAGALRDGDLVAPWLHGVAHRVAVRARAKGASRHARERPLDGAPDPEGDFFPFPGDALDAKELAEALERELARLPEALRKPLVLCYLEGLTHDEAALRLRWPVGTVRSRMARARSVLRGRLAKQGRPVSGAVLLQGLGRGIVPRPWLDATVRAAFQFSQGTLPASATALALAKGVLLTMSLHKAYVVAAATCLCLLGAGGASALGYQFGGGGKGEAASPSEKTAAKPGPGADAGKPAPDRREVLIGKVDQLSKTLDGYSAKLAELQAAIDDLKAGLGSLKGEGQGGAAAPARKGGVNARAKAAGGMGGMMGGGGGMGGGGFGGGMGGMMGGGGGFGGGGMGGVMPGMMSGAMNGMGGRMGGGGGDMTGMMSQPRLTTDGEKAPQYLRQGAVIYIVSPDETKVTAYNSEKGTAKALEFPKTVRVIPITNAGNFTALGFVKADASQAAEPEIDRLAVYNPDFAEWYVQKLGPPFQGEAVPIVASNLASYTLGNKIYAYSVEAARWGQLTLPEGTTPRPLIDGTAILVENAGHLHIFSATSGKWADIDTRAEVKADKP